jgi:hypothetical protein
MAVLVELGDDDQPKDRDKPKNPLCMSAIMLCKEPAFQQFCNERRLPDDGQSLEDNAASCIKHFCQINSRKELDLYPQAADAFSKLMSIYHSWYREQQ